MMLSDLIPIAARNIVQAQRRGRRTRLRDVSLGALAPLALYGFCLAFRRALSAAEKPITAELKVVPPERGAGIFEN
jgi:hypothetical protein